MVIVISKRITTPCEHLINVIRLWFGNDQSDRENLDLNSNYVRTFELNILDTHVYI